MMKQLIRIAAALGALTTIGFQVYAANFPKEPPNLGHLVFAVWGIAAFAAMFVMAGKITLQPRGMKILAVLCWIITLATGALLTDAFILHPDAQNAIAFLTLPVIQGVLLGVGHSVAKGLDRKRVSDA